MQVDLQKLEGTKVQLSIGVGQEEVNQATEKAFDKLNREVKISGFRPGKVPRAVLEKYVGEDTLKREVTEILLQDGLRYAIKEKNLQIIAYPQIKEIGELKKDNGFEFKAEIELRPEINLPQYKGMELEKEEVRITEENVEKALQVLQKKYSYLVEIKDRPSQKGDIIFIEYESKVGDRSITKVEKKVAGIELGKGAFFLPLEEKIEGMNLGEEKEISLILPEDYPDKEIAGKMVNFKVILKEIKGEKIPEISDEFAKSLNFENLEKLRENVKIDLENQGKNLEREILERKIIKKLLDESDFECPVSLVEEEKKAIFAHLESRLKEENKTIDDYLKEREITKEKLEEEINENAKRNVKFTLIIEEIADKENIKVTAVDRDKALNDMAKSLNQDPVKFRENMLKDRRRIIYIDYNILERKVIDFILNSANIKEKEGDEKK